MRKLTNRFFQIVFAVGFLYFHSEYHAIDYAASTFIEAELKCKEGIEELCFSDDLKSKILADWSPDGAFYLLLSIFCFILLIAKLDIYGHIENAYNKAIKSDTK